MAVPNLQLVLLLPYDGFASSRRLPDEESQGARQWYSLWEGLHSETDSSQILEDDGRMLQGKVMEALKGLPIGEYASFCEAAHYHFYPAEGNHPLSDLPRLRTVHREYDHCFEKLRQKHQRARKNEDRYALSGGGLGAIVGAVTGGELTERIAQTESFKNFAEYFPLLSLTDNSERVVSLAAGLLIGVMFWVGIGNAFQRYDASIQGREKSLRERAHNEFISRVEEYIHQNQPT